MSAFEGSSTYGFHLAGNRYFDFLFETLPHKDAHGRSAFRCHVFAEGERVTTISSPTRFQPAPIFLTYHEQDLYAYANLGKTKDSTPWRLNLGPVVVDRVIDLTSASVLYARGALLVIHDVADPGDVRFVVLHTSAEERSKLER